MQKALLWIALVSIMNFLYAEEAMLPSSLTDSEKAEIMAQYGARGSWEEAWQQYLRSKEQDVASSKPKNLLYAPAEFEKADGVCFSWRGYSSLLKNLIKEVSLNAKAYVAVSSNKNGVLSSLRNHGCNMDNVEILNTRLDSVWMRDYGPFFIYTQDGDREVLDLVYNRPRPRDDKFPSFLAQEKGWKSHLCKLILPGGNLIVDGHGVAIMTDVVFDPKQGGDPNLSMEQLNTYMRDYFGCHTTHVIEDMEKDGTGHIDMFCKLLDDRNVIVGQYAKPSDGAGNNYEILNRNAEKIAQMKNGRGENFIVHRIIMPAYNWGTSYTHTNSLMINKTVLVPVYGRGTDEEALDVYRKLLPNHKIVGFDCNQIIGANGAIHCITKMVMSDPLVVDHTPLTNLQKGESVTVNATISATHALKDFGVKLYWKTATQGYQSLVMDSFDGKNFSCVVNVPTDADDFTYYIKAENSVGMYETAPENIEEAFSVKAK